MAAVLPVFLAPHTANKRNTKENTVICSADQFYQAASALLNKSVVQIDLNFNAVETSHKLSAIYKKCIAQRGSEEEIENFCAELISHNTLSASFWTERYDTIVTLIHEYYNLTGDLGIDAVASVNDLLKNWISEQDDQPSLLTTYFQLAKKEVIRFDIINTLSSPSNRGEKNAQFMQSFQKAGLPVCQLSEQIDKTVCHLKGKDLCLEEFVDLINSTVPLERTLDLKKIGKSLSENGWVNKSLDTVRKFYDSQIKNNSAIDSAALFYFLLFLDRFNVDEGQKTGETGIFKEVNQARGTCRWNVTEPLWDAIVASQINLNFFRELEPDDLKKLFHTMHALEKANYEVCISMSELNVTDPDQPLAIQRPTILKKMVDEQILNQIFDHLS